VDHPSQLGLGIFKSLLEILKVLNFVLTLGYRRGNVEAVAVGDDLLETEDL
jgi:hypothetical protein